jgi:hypothetical protein
MSEIIIKNYDLVVSIKREKEDLTISEMLEMMTAALVGITFPMEVIENGILKLAGTIELKRELT